MLLEELDSVPQAREALHGLVLDLLDITKVSHDLGEHLLLPLRVEALWKLLDSVLHFINEVLGVLELPVCVLEQEDGELLNPLLNDNLEILDQWG